MAIALERFLIVNFFMNALILFMAAKITSGAVRPQRLVFGAIIATAYALIAYTAPNLKHLLFIPALLCMGACAARVRSLRELAYQCFAVLGCTFLLGGTAYALSMALSNSLLALAVCAPVGILCIFRFIRSRSVHDASIRVCIRLHYGGKMASVDGFIDTGNRITDAITGLPVIVTSAQPLRALLPADLNPMDLSTLPRGFRVMMLCGVCGAQMAMCFHPQVQLLSGSDWKDVQTIVAISAHPLPEGALVPASLI